MLVARIPITRRKGSRFSSMRLDKNGAASTASRITARPRTVIDLPVPVNKKVLRLIPSRNNRRTPSSHKQHLPGDCQRRRLRLQQPTLCLIIYSLRRKELSRTFWSVCFHVLLLSTLPQDI